MNTTVARWQTLAALAAGVLAVHLWLLLAAPVAVQMRDPPALRPLITRTLAVAAQPEVSAAPLPVLARESRPASVARPAVVARNEQVAAAATSPSNHAGAAEPATHSAIAPAEPVPAARAADTQRANLLALPGSAKLHYKVTAFARSRLWDANGELHWRHDGSSYDAKLEVSAPLMPTRTQRSTGQITSEGLAPLRFSDKARSEEAAHFERDKGKVSFSSNRPDTALLAGAQDRLSVMLQLAAMIAGEPAKFPAATTITVQTAGTRDAESWIFTVEGEETLQLPGGAVAALKLTRSPRREFDQKVELWLAPAMDYVPVRLRLTQPNGDWIDQQWSSTDRG